MKKTLIGFAVTVLVLIVFAFVFKESLINFVYETVTNDMFVTQDNDSFDPGSAIGMPFPKIDASINNKKVLSIDEFSGEKGTIFVVSRSIDWCPYCMKQMAALNNDITKFNEAGIKLVGLTYDLPEKQKAFKNKFSIQYPILSDNNAATVKILGLLNEEYSPGDDAYGIGHPGAFIIDANGIVVGKVFLESYAIRMDSRSLLLYAQTVLAK